jgi:predicted transcriptional regulator/gamma-glutamylcysteine synthetase
MGVQTVSLVEDKEQMQHFVRNLLKDVKALEYMLNNDWFESGTTRIGAEQEMCLVDKNFKPAPIAMEVLAKQDYPWLETELARFNLETNLTPRVFENKCLSDMETELRDSLDKVQHILDSFDSKVLLTGIMPTLKKSDLGFHNLTPKKRYKALMDSLSKLRGEAHELRLEGIDELRIKHNSPLLEACNTSFQVHLQVSPNDFVKMYNLAQTVAGPMIAISANSPMLFGRRLWHESRIAIFQQSIDNRIAQHHLRDRSPRVTFGSDWLQDSVMEIYREDISRFRVLLSSDVQEDALKMIKEGKTPKLHSLNVHNSTVYRWNRPCYGISENGKPHLRIENRVLPAGPTVIDEMANTAFWLGLMKGMEKEYGDIRKYLGFEDVRDNFLKASRTGIDSKFTWINDKKYTAADLTLNELLPLAREGLKENNIDTSDIDRYMSVIEGRSKKVMTGARWMLRTYTKLAKETNRDEALTTLTAAIVKNQMEGNPVHEWPMPTLEDLKEYSTSKVTVEEIMETDLFTVHQDDIIEFASDIMSWRKLRHILVENEKGQLTGLVSSALLLKHFSKNAGATKTTLVEEIMVSKPITVTTSTLIVDAIQVMQENEIGCLPVVDENNILQGLISETNFLKISRRLLKRTM